MNTLVSIVIPTFERAEFVEECINSVINQSYENIEIILCDGGSTDANLIKILNKYKKNFSYFDSIKDNGHAEAIRRGFSKANGEIIGYLCSDDLLEKDAITKLVSAYIQNSDGDVFYGHTSTINSHGMLIGEKIVFPFNKYSFISGLPICQPSTFWTSRVYRLIGSDFGGMNYEYNVFEPQSDLLYRLYSLNAKFIYIDAFLSSDRRHPGCVSYIITDNIKLLSDKARFTAFPHLKYKVILFLYKLIGRSIQLYFYILQNRFVYIYKKIIRRYFA